MATPIPPNDAPFVLGQILTATGGRLRGPLGDAALRVSGIGTDTRALRPGQAFVALRGERFDGHEHLAAAASAGAALAIVERPVVAPPGLTILQVASTLRALGELAGVHLGRWRRLPGPRTVVALTGSAGKTTTKRALAALLAAQAPGSVLSAAGNLNNLVGVPATVLTLAAAHHYAVLELGTSGPGEIARLARLVRPDVGVLTLIAAAHSAGLGGIEAIAHEKGALFAALDRPDCVAVGNRDDARVAASLAGCPASRILGYGHDAAADYRIVARVVTGERAATVTIARADGSEVRFATPLLGAAGALGCAAALAVSEALLPDRLDGAAIGAALAALGTEREGPGRLFPRQAPSGLLVLDDSYNANPASCRSSLEAAREVAASLGRRLVLVLGEMRELGAESRVAHEELGRQAASASVVVAVGGDARLVAEAASEAGATARFVPDATAAARLATELVGTDDVVLVKGSRAVGTEEVVRALLRAHGGSAPGVGQAPRQARGEGVAP